MNTTRLGRTGLEVSRLCLGTMNFGPATTEPDSFHIMDRALEAGVQFFDTADVYGHKMNVEHGAAGQRAHPAAHRGAPAAARAVREAVRGAGPAARRRRAGVAPPPARGDRPHRRSAHPGADPGRAARRGAEARRGGVASARRDLARPGRRGSRGVRLVSGATRPPPSTQSRGQALQPWATSRSRPQNLHTLAARLMVSAQNGHALVGPSSACGGRCWVCAASMRSLMRCASAFRWP
jgi:Aldo/keto reductase family